MAGKPAIMSFSVACLLENIRTSQTDTGVGQNHAIDLPAINHTLRPTYSTQSTKALRLHNQRNIELLRNGVNPKRYPR